MRRSALLAAIPAVAAALVVPSAAEVSACTPWTQRVVAEGLGSLENVEPDGRGGLLISASSRSAVERLTPDGTVTTVAAGLTSPGGLRVRGTTLYATTGDSAAAGATADDSGTIEQIDLRTGKRRTWASGLTMPNGLAFLPDGSAVTSRDINVIAPTGITRVDPKTRAVQPSWADLADTNGLAVDPTGTWLYAVETFTLPSNLYRIRIADPSDVEVVASLFEAGVPKGLDDMTIDAEGVLYITANGAGQVIRFDPATKSQCTIASGLQNPSAVKFGRGPGWPSDRLYVVGFDGRVRELTPPA